MTSDDNPRVFVPPPLVFVGLLGLGLLIDRNQPGFGATLFIGLGLGLAGLGLVLSALGLFRTNRTRPEPWQPASTLVVSGIYRFTRNPMYLGMAAISLGIATAFSSPPAIVLVTVAAIIIDRTVVPREEAYLVRRFGRDYEAYRRTVRRWI